MEISIVQPDELLTTSWAGGTTTQLYIHPARASYADRNFDYRLSTATVQIEKSEFTQLPGFSRKLMVLEGNLQLNHENHHSILLNKFDQDAFEGDWNTTSVGFCTDFNLMTDRKHQGTITAKTLQIIQSELVTPNKHCIQLLVYVVTGVVTISINNLNHRMDKGGLFSVTTPAKRTFQVLAEKPTEIVVVQIFKK